MRSDTAAPDTPEFAWQQWAMDALGNVVAQLPAMVSKPKREHIRQVLRDEVERLADGNIAVLV